MKKILLSAFACEPEKGSEEGNGWNWATGLANLGFEVHCITHDVNQTGIDAFARPQNLHFHYVKVPLVTSNLSRMGPLIYPYYLSWQYLAYKAAARLNKRLKFDIAHHISWGSIQMGSHFYKLGIPFVFGPAGGGQHAPKAFKEYFGTYWPQETRREKISSIMINYNPGCKGMLKKAHAVLVSNTDTLTLVKSAGAVNYHFNLDTALPESFFPEVFNPKDPKPGQFKLLWVGRFMARKGVTMTLDVMRELRQTHPQIKLTIVGYGESKQDVIDHINKYQLQDTVTLAGRVSYQQVRNYYESHDVFLFNSLRDSCPAQVLEAAAFGMPVVTLDLHGQSLLVNDETGIRCPVTTPAQTVDELRKAIIYLYNNPQKVKQMSHAANKFAHTQTWPKKIAGIVADYYPQ